MKFYNKCSENSRSQIVFRTDIFRKLTLGAPEFYTNELNKGKIMQGKANRIMITKTTYKRDRK